MSKVPRLTKEQAAIIGAFTGITMGPFSTIHEYAERVLGRPVWTHEFADKALHEGVEVGRSRRLSSPSFTRSRPMTDPTPTPALPDGYIIATSAHYPGGLNPFTRKPMGYSYSVQLMSQATADMPRGTGQTSEEALANAIANAGGDDGLSALFRKMLGPKEGNA